MADVRVRARRREAVLALRLIEDMPRRRNEEKPCNDEPVAQKVERADFVLTNNGSLDFLREQVIRLVEQLTKPAA